MDRRERKPSGDSGSSTRSEEVAEMAAVGPVRSTYGWIGGRSGVVAQFAGRRTRDVFFRTIFVPGTRHGGSAERAHSGGGGGVRGGGGKQRGGFGKKLGGGRGGRPHLPSRTLRLG